MERSGDVVEVTASDAIALIYTRVAGKLLLQQ